jgi:hypothetical protein
MDAYACSVTYYNSMGYTIPVITAMVEPIVESKNPNLETIQQFKTELESRFSPSHLSQR